METETIFVNHSPQPPHVGSGFAERRLQWRRDVLLQGELSCTPWACTPWEGTVLVTDISTGGARLDIGLPSPQWKTGLPCTLAITRQPPQTGYIVAHADHIARIAFSSPSNAGFEKIDMLIRHGTLSLLETAMADHERFAARVSGVLVGNGYLRPDDLPKPQACTLGRWCATVAKTHICSCPSFDAVVEHHILIHDYARKILLFLQNGNIQQAKLFNEKMKSAVQRIISLLSKLRMEIIVRFDKATMYSAPLDPLPDRCC